MATCNPNTAIAANPCLMELSDDAMRTVQFAAIKAWALARNPGLDVTLSGIMARSGCLIETSEGAINTSVFSSLCTIKG